MPLPRRRGSTEQAAEAAIDTACHLLRLAAIGNEFNEIADRAIKDRMTYCGFLTELLMPECDNRARRWIPLPGLSNERLCLTFGGDGGS
ncbi:hypothetical protein [Streptomyces sp. NPDC019224]|uniref:hypothetical protein n=1 Tax=Streptomyces sp. NPDC019224 TaxID=3154484 RepID=UPI0033D55EDD